MALPRCENAPVNSVRVTNIDLRNEQIQLVAHHHSYEWPLTEEKKERKKELEKSIYNAP